MKKVFIGLLIAAAGAVTYYLLLKENNPVTSNAVQQEKIIGKWKLDSLYALKDSANNSMGIIGIIEPDLRKYSYEFKKDGGIFFSIGDSLTADSSRYEWNKNNQLAWLEHPADTTGELFTISLLNTTNLRLLSADSVVLQFTKVK